MRTVPLVRTRRHLHKMAIGKICNFCKQPYRWGGAEETEFMCGACIHKFYQLTLEFSDKLAEKREHPMEKPTTNHTQTQES